jgi:hypothetical protein
MPAPTYKPNASEEINVLNRLVKAAERIAAALERIAKLEPGKRGDRSSTSSSSDEMLYR